MGKEGGAFSRALEGVGAALFSQFEESLSRMALRKRAELLWDCFLQTSSRGLVSLDSMEVKRNS